MAVNKMPTIKGIRIQSINLAVVIVALLLCVAFVFCTISIREASNTLAMAAEECIQCLRYAQMAKEGSYFLTDQVRLFATTGDKQFADAYFEELNETKRRDRAIDGLRDMTLTVDSQDRMIAAMTMSNELVYYEVYAIRLGAEAMGDDLSTYDPRVGQCQLSEEDEALSPEEKMDRAEDIVFDENYRYYRDGIDEWVQSFVDTTYQIAVGYKDDSFRQVNRDVVLLGILIVAVTVVGLVDVTCVYVLVLKPLKTHMKSLQDGTAMEKTGAYEFQYLAQLYNNSSEVRYETEKELMRKAEHDALTGLLNKGSFDRIAAEYMIEDRNMAVIILDVDFFKEVNDRHGHAVGDEMLRHVADLLRTHFRPDDTVVRYGGDEFAVIMLDVGADAAENIGARVNSLNQMLQNPTNGLPKVTISAGMAFSRKGYSSELFELADEALYYIKRNGKNGWHVSERVLG